MLLGKVWLLRYGLPRWNCGSMETGMSVGTVTWPFRIAQWLTSTALLHRLRCIFLEAAHGKREWQKSQWVLVLLILLVFGVNSSSSLWTQSPLLSIAQPSITTETCWSQGQLMASSGCSVGPELLLRLPTIMGPQFHMQVLSLTLA